MLPRIHCITDVVTSECPSPELLEDLARVGVDAVQVRAKQLGDRDLVAFTREVIAAVRPFGTRVIVNDRVDVALVTGADGVHLGRDDLAVRDARRLSPEGFLVGATCRGPADVEQARREGADYAGVGPVFDTSTKRGLPDALGLEVLRQAADLLPVVAVAGITAERVPAVMAAGAYGVAVVAAVWRAPDPPRAAKEICELVSAA